MRSRALNNLSVDGGGETIGTGGTMRRGRRLCVPPSVRRRALPWFRTGSSRQLSSISFSARPAASSSLQRGVSLTSSPPALGRRAWAAMARATSRATRSDFVGFFTACDTRSAASMRFSAASAAATSARVGGTGSFSLSLEDS